MSDRRYLLRACLVIPFLGLWKGCGNKNNAVPASGRGILDRDQSAMKLSMKMKREHLHTMLDQRVKLVMERSHHCAQSTYFALARQFGLGGNDVLKALTPLPGLAERGRTCGAVTGALLAMGMIFGRDELEDWEAYRKALHPANKFCRQFEEAMGTLDCCEIQRHAFGKSFDLMDPAQLKAFQLAGATDKCTQVVQNSVRIAADLILEGDSFTDSGAPSSGMSE